jgi:hypothetical protein
MFLYKCCLIPFAKHEIWLVYSYIHFDETSHQIRIVRKHSYFGTRTSFYFFDRNCKDFEK